MGNWGTLMGSCSNRQDAVGTRDQAVYHNGLPIKLQLNFGRVRMRRLRVPSASSFSTITNKPFAEILKQVVKTASCRPPQSKIESW